MVAFPLPSYLYTPFVFHRRRQSHSRQTPPTTDGFERDSSPRACLLRTAFYPVSFCSSRLRFSREGVIAKILFSRLFLPGRRASSSD